MSDNALAVPCIFWQSGGSHFDYRAGKDRNYVGVLNHHEDISVISEFRKVVSTVSIKLKEDLTLPTPT